MLDDEQKFLANIRNAETDDLLGRVTVERWGMDPQAVDWIKQELASRDVTPGQILDYEMQFEGCLRDENGRWTGLAMKDGKTVPVAVVVPHATVAPGAGAAAGKTAPSATE